MLLLKLFIFTHLYLSSNCNKEHILVKRGNCDAYQDVNGVPIHWIIPVHGNTYVAEPHCIDEKNVFVERYCQGNKFEPEPICTKVQENSRYCPDNYIDINTGCAYQVDEATWENSICPYANILSYDYVPDCSEMGSGSQCNKHWYPASQNKLYGYSEFYSLKFDSNYGKIVEYTYRGELEVPNTCLIYQDGLIESTNCQEILKRYCPYNYLTENYCCNVQNSDCMNEDYGSEKCLCRTGTSCYEKLLKNHQNSLMINMICKNHCEFTLPLKFDEAIGMTWNDGIPVEYTYWSYNTENNEFTDETKFYLSNDGWQIGSANNGVCNEECNFNKPSIKMNTLNGKVNILIEDANSFATAEGGMKIFCFTDSLPNSLIERIDTFPDNDYTAEVNYNVVESGSYSCEGFYIVDFTKIRSEVLIFVDHVYAIRISVRYDRQGICANPTIGICAYPQILAFETIFNNNNPNLQIRMKWMATPDIEQPGFTVTYLVHICVDSSHDYLSTYDYLNQNLLNSFNQGSNFVNYNSFTKVKYCMETNIQLSNGELLSVPMTEAGTYYTSDIECDDNFIVIECVYHLEGAEWGPESCTNPATTTTTQKPTTTTKATTTTTKTTTRTTPPPETITDKLESLLYSNKSAEEIVDELTVLTEEPNALNKIDVDLLANIFEKISQEKLNLSNFITVLSNTMSVNQNVLEESQFTCNSTNKILYNFDLILDTNKEFTKQSDLLISPNVIVAIFNTKSSKIIGLALCGTKPEYIYKNMSLNDVLMIPNLEIASLIPDEFRKYELPRKDHKTENIVMIAYVVDSLFNEVSKDSKNGGKNFGILLPVEKFSAKLPIIYKLESNEKTSCAYWLYQDVNGGWFAEIPPEDNLNFKICYYNHVTNFALLVLDEELKDSKVLDIINAVECLLSLIGFLAIFLTAICFKNWRQNRGNKILLHYSGISFLQISLLYISGWVYNLNDRLVCTIVGSLLHYVLVSQFCWMLVIAFLQYKRYVQVLHGPQRYVLAKAFLLSYGVPLIPVTVVLILFPDTYNESDVGLCYPSGNALTFTVLLPIGLVVFINLVIFVLIVIEMCCCTRSDKCFEDDIFHLRVGLIFLLFFMLGITWLFGLGAQIFNSEFLAYAFALSASIQGFILFIFFIVFNKSARVMYSYVWHKYIC